MPLSVRLLCISPKHILQVNQTFKTLHLLEKKYAVLWTIVSRLKYIVRNKIISVVLRAYGLKYSLNEISIIKPSFLLTRNNIIFATKGSRNCANVPDSKFLKVVLSIVSSQRKVLRSIKDIPHSMEIF